MYSMSVVVWQALIQCSAFVQRAMTMTLLSLRRVTSQTNTLPSEISLLRFVLYTVLSCVFWLSGCNGKFSTFSFVHCINVAISTVRVIIHDSRIDMQWHLPTRWSIVDSVWHWCLSSRAASVMWSLFCHRHYGRYRCNLFPDCCVDRDSVHVTAHYSCLCCCCCCCCFWSSF